ncbi:hypothetical protein FC756_05725 [Lysinibacillus mangiferihumi]|uniref:Uncharacterized protein n=1 Tax=Lysinibacillus mangiferihumi TaxID=1130819 RepID=A0A4U2ZB80_9BACI|nr:hypothetical protein [Lysinibacillus mangiferihumi]TKI71504.1 hypothetical protein FC756_05725 [Lysinibacillus mangiferihumi]
MANGVNNTILILTETFSCTIYVAAEEITIKKPSHEQQSIEQLIIQAEQRAYQETLTAYKLKSTLSNSICDTYGFEDTFQQKMDAYMAQYKIVKVSDDDLLLLSLVSPLTAGLNLHTPMIYKAPHCCIMYARGKQIQSLNNHSIGSNTVNFPTDVTDYIASTKTFNSVTKASEAYYYCPTNFTGLCINESGISFNITSAFNSWNKTSIKH